MTPARKMLLESLSGHLALLAATHPKKAATPVARRAALHVRQSLRIHRSPEKAAA